MRGPRLNTTSQSGARASRLPSALVLTLLMLLVWYALDGADGLAWGLPFALCAVAVALWLAPPSAHPLRLRALPGFALYFVLESLRGAADVAWRAMHPRMPLQPALESCALRVPAGAPRTLLVSCVSLLPGTLSAELDAEANLLRVHVLAGAAEPGLRVLEARIASLYGLTLAERGGAC